jgi:hypothetical protein
MKKIYYPLAFVLLFSVNSFAQISGKFSGYMFGDYYYNIERDTGINNLPDVAIGGKKDLNGFQFRRIYLTYDNDISENFSARVRLEADQVANTSDGKIGVFVKDANITWKNVFEGSNLIFGIQPSPSFEVSEAFFGFRFIEKTIMDLRGITPSRDIAVSLRGRFDKEEKLRYWLMFGNGSGNRPEIDKYKRFYGWLQYSPAPEFTFTLYADYNSRPKIESPIAPGTTVANSDYTVTAFAGYAKKNVFSIGVEAFQNFRQNAFVENGALKTLTKAGFTVSGTYFFSPQLSFMGRYDYYNPASNNIAVKNARNLFITSLNYKPVDKLIISPNAVIETYQTTASGRVIKPSVTGRVTVYYTFL